MRRLCPQSEAGGCAPSGRRLRAGGCAPPDQPRSWVFADFSRLVEKKCTSERRGGGKGRGAQGRKGRWQEATQCLCAFPTD